MTLHAAKGLEFPVVYMVAVEQGLLPHERSLARDEEIEEERRLAFVGMTRAKEELYLSHARLREFRGNAMYVVPSMFLDVLKELPDDVIEFADLSAPHRSIDTWRQGNPVTQPSWNETGIRPQLAPAAAPASESSRFTEGMLVQHETYGTGRVTEVSGYGALRKIKVRFATAGERTFVAEKARLTVVQKN
jgi:DNA helicase II / ATP-dependent DNA helicase PcrA